MTKLAAENFHGNSSDSAVAGSSLSESSLSNMTLKELALLMAAKRPKDVCIIDKDGYIACGPIVGSPRPEEKPIEISPNPKEPLDPPRSKCPGFYEIPVLPFEPKKPPSGEFPKPYEPLPLPFEPKEPPSGKCPSPYEPLPLPYRPDNKPSEKYPPQLQIPDYLEK